MVDGFAPLDWLIVGGYLILLSGMGWYFSLQKSTDTRDYFLGGNKMPFWVVAISVLATTQSAATFLGGPDQGYRGDYTYVATNISALIAAFFVAKLLIPKFYAQNATTVYDILAARIGGGAMRAAGGMYLIGRLFASGVRLYMAAIAVSMILYANINADSIITAAFIMMALGFLATFMGGIRAVLWSDLVQFLIYTASAVAVLYFLLAEIPAGTGEILEGLRHSPGGQNKLQLLNFDITFSSPFALISVFTSLTLLYIGNFGLDQDTTQRLLTCKDDKEGGRALVISVLIAIPLVILFISIGQLLYVFYNRPDLMGVNFSATENREFSGEKITIFMYYILNELPAGLKGLVTVGVIAATISSLNSGLNSMSSVIVQDFYRPWREKKSAVMERHFVLAGRLSMGLVGIALFLMSILCFYWQKYTDMPLLDFALSVMIFAYSGLLGVYCTVIFTKRGSTRSVCLALVVGFMVTLAQQNYVIDMFGFPQVWKDLAFSWQLCIGTACSFLVCFAGKTPEPMAAKTDPAVLNL